jgi:AraC family transcriptional regulator of adaptative response/methylated-DNA-[protein]-cysteine methyltransferase
MNMPLDQATKLEQHKFLKTSWLDTPLGSMIAIADDRFLYLLEFADCRGLEKEVKYLRQKTKSVILPGIAEPIHSIENELRQYFDGTLKKFETPFVCFGSPFQKQVWEKLQKIPFGETCSYADLAKAIDNPSAFRAVANANGANQLAIVIPCHRVINTNGNIGGYGGGIERKQWLINHEKHGI